MKIAITGASGFIGRATVACALEANHHVLAIARKPLDMEHPQLTCHSCDLTDEQDNLADALKGCDAVVHLAAAMQGENQYGDTMKATDRVLVATAEAGIECMVGLSSIAVLDYVTPAPMCVIDEGISANPRDEQLGTYALMKRDQERLMGSFKARSIILRPGLVYSSDQLSDAHVGFKLLAAKHEGQVPVVHVDDVASASIKACESQAASGVFHLVNDQLPSQSAYLSTLKNRGLGFRIGVPWQLYQAFGRAAGFGFHLMNKLPDAFYLNSLAARQKPFRFSNKKAKTQFAWSPRNGLET